MEVTAAVAACLRAHVADTAVADTAVAEGWGRSAARARAAAATSMSAVGLLGALLGKLRANSRAPAGTPVSIAIPPVGDAEGAVARAASLLHDAAHLGGWKLVAAPSAAQALGVALARKWPFGKEPWTSPAVRVLVLDMGASSTIAAVIKLTPPAAPEIKGSSPRGAKAEVLAEASDAFLGASLYNEKLFDHFAAKVKETYVR